MDEMGAVGLAEVVAIERVGDLPEVCARLGELGVRVTAAGDIRSVPGLVTGTFAHTSGEVFDLKLKSEPQPIGVTGPRETLEVPTAPPPGSPRRREHPHPA